MAYASGGGEEVGDGGIGGWFSSRLVCVRGVGRVFYRLLLISISFPVLGRLNIFLEDVCRRASDVFFSPDVCDYNKVSCECLYLFRATQMRNKRVHSASSSSDINK